MTKLVNLLACLLFGHQAERNNFDHYIGDCDRCTADVRPSWMVQMENEDRLEALAIQYLERTREAKR